MNVIIVDDEMLILYQMKEYLQEILNDDHNIMTFSNPNDALNYANANTVDIAFLDIEMMNLNGLELAEKLKERNFNTFVVFVTGYTHYAIKAFDVEASGYITKPFELEDFQKEINKYVKRFEKIKKSKILIQTFGNFDVLIEGQAVVFSNSKSKELFALLVDKKGASITIEEVIYYLWEDRPNDENTKALYRKTTSSLRATMQEYGMEDIFQVSRGQISMDVSKINCDYYNYLNGNQSAINAFKGKYMSQYSWAEETLGGLLS